MTATKGETSRWARLRARLARSSHVFLLGVVIACDIEVLVDWNAAFFEIGVLRDRVRERGVSYVSMLARSSTNALRSGNRAALTRLTDGLFDDADVIYVRFTDTAGNVRFERLDPEFGARFQEERGSRFDDYYAKLLHRDLDGVLHDPVGQQQRMAASRYRDIPERWSELLTAVAGHFVAPTPTKPHSELVLYQQALRTTEHQRDDLVTWAFGIVQDEGADPPIGAVLVAFNMDRTNSAIRGKYLKGLGMVVFFVGLILVQNVASRRDRLRLLDLEQRNAAARAAIRSSLPAPLVAQGLRAAAALEQSAIHVDGMLVETIADAAGVWLLVLDPDGEGVDAASVALHVRAVFQSRRERGEAPDLEGEVGALGRAARDMPLSRPIGVLLAHVSTGGHVEAALGPIGKLTQLRDGQASPLDGEPLAETPPGVVGPLARVRSELGTGEALVAVCGGLAGGEPPVDVEAIVGFVARAAPRPAVELVSDAATWARGHTPDREGRDLALGVVQRA